MFFRIVARFELTFLLFVFALSGLAYLAGQTRPARVMAYYQRDVGVRLLDAGRGAISPRPLTQDVYTEHVFWSPDGRWMTFIEFDTVILADGVGSRVNQIDGVFGGTAYRPTWSPDGQYFAFSGLVDDLTDISIYSLATHTLTNITNTPTVVEHSPVWVGNQLFYTGFDVRTGTSGVYIIDQAGNARQTIIEGTTYTYHARGSPDGSHIALTATRDNSERDLFIADVANGDLHKPDDALEFNNSFPSWSAGSQHLAWIAAQGMNGRDIVIFDVAEDALLEVIPSLWAFHRWSPQGQRLLYLDSGDLYLRDLDADSTRRLTRSLWVNSDGRSVDWSDDGRWIAFVSNRSGASHIFMVDADTGARRQLTFEGRNVLPSWQPSS
jgi:Tol biopolymer transport system component